MHGDFTKHQSEVALHCTGCFFSVKNRELNNVTIDTCFKAVRVCRGMKRSVRICLIHTENMYIRVKANISGPGQSSRDV